MTKTNYVWAHFKLFADIIWNSKNKIKQMLSAFYNTTMLCFVKDNVGIWKTPACLANVEDIGSLKQQLIFRWMFYHPFCHVPLLAIAKVITNFILLNTDLLTWYITFTQHHMPTTTLGTTNNIYNQMTTATTRLVAAQ